MSNSHIFKKLKFLHENIFKIESMNNLKNVLIDIDMNYYNNFKTDILNLKESLCKNQSLSCVLWQG